MKLVVLKWYQIHSQSSVFGLAVLYPTEVKFHVFGTSKHREGKLLSLFFILAILISTLGRFSWANKKKNLSCTQLYIILENSPKIIDYTPRLDKNCVSITQWRQRTSTSCWRNDGTIKENLCFDNQSYQVVLLFLLQCFLKEIENMYSMFLSSYRNTRESLGELKKAVETNACGSCSHSISHSPKLPLVFLWLDRNTVHVF